MRLLFLLLLGTLFFGFAFPAAIFMIGLFAAILVIIMVIGILRGGTFKVYTVGNGGFSREYRKNSPPDDPEVIGAEDSENKEYNQYSEQQATSSDDDQEGEVIELPATALRKEEEKEK